MKKARTDLTQQQPSWPPQPSHGLPLAQTSYNPAWYQQTTQHASPYGQPDLNRRNDSMDPYSRYGTQTHTQSQQSPLQHHQTHSNTIAPPLAVLQQQQQQGQHQSHSQQPQPPHLQHHQQQQQHPQHQQHQQQHQQPLQQQHQQAQHNNQQAHQQNQHPHQQGQQQQHPQAPPSLLHQQPTPQQQPAPQQSQHSVPTPVTTPAQPRQRKRPAPSAAPPAAQTPVPTPAAQPAQTSTQPSQVPAAGQAPASAAVPSPKVAVSGDDAPGDTPAGPPASKKSRTNTPWTPAEELKLKQLRDQGSSWAEIAKSFPARTEGSVKKHWYKDMHYAEFAEDESAALMNAIKEYENNKWKAIGQKVGKPAKACEQYAKEHFPEIYAVAKPR